MKRVKHTVSFFLKDLMVWTFAYTILGLALGTILDTFVYKDERVLMYVGFVGEIFLRSLKCFAIPLLASFIASTIGGFECFISKRVVSQFVCIVLLFKLEAVILSMIVTTLVYPGDCLLCIANSCVKDDRNITIEDQYLDMFRNIFPDNVILIFSNTYRTKLELKGKGARPENLRSWEIVGGTMDSVNILGIISVSIGTGVAMKVMGEKKVPLLRFVDCIYSVCLLLLRCLAFLAPLGILSILAADIMYYGILDTLTQIGCYILTFCIIYGIQMLILYPAIYGIFIKRNIFKLYRLLPCVRRYSLYSKNVSFPGTINYFSEAGYDPNLVSFVITIGDKVSKNGASAFIPIIALFVAQKYEIPFGAPEYTLCGLLSIIISAAVPAIPFGSLALSMGLLQALGYPMSDLGIFFCVDWLRHRTEILNNFVGNCIILSLIDRMNKDKRDEILDRKTREEARKAKEQEEAEQEAVSEEETEA